MRPARLLAIACAAAGCNQILDIDDPPPPTDANLPSQRIGGRVQERYKDAMNVTMFRAANDAQIDLEAGGEIVATTTTNAAGEYLMELPGGASRDVVLRARRADDLDKAVFPADPITEDTTVSFTMYTQAAVASLAMSATIQHDPADRYLLVRVFDLVGSVSGAVISSSSGGVRYADDAGVLMGPLTQTSMSGLAAIFAIKTQAITVTVSSGLGTRQRDIDFGSALTGFLPIRPN